jgi:hypothetical protein
MRSSPFLGTLEACNFLVLEEDEHTSFGAPLIRQFVLPLPCWNLSSRKRGIKFEIPYKHRRRSASCAVRGFPPRTLTFSQCLAPVCEGRSTTSSWPQMVGRMDQWPKYSGFKPLQPDMRYIYFNLRTQPTPTSDWLMPFIQDRYCRCHLLREGTDHAHLVVENVLQPWLPVRRLRAPGSRPASMHRRSIDRGIAVWNLKMMGIAYRSGRARYRAGPSRRRRPCSI